MHLVLIYMESNFQSWIFALLALWLALSFSVICWNAVWPYMETDCGDRFQKLKQLTVVLENRNSSEFSQF